MFRFGWIANLKAVGGLFTGQATDRRRSLAGGKSVHFLFDAQPQAEFLE